MSRIIEHMSLRTDNLTIPQGPTWETRWPIVDSAGQPANLDGWGVRAHVRTQKLSETVLHEWSSTLGNASILGSDVSLKVSATESSAWNWRKGFYDVEIFHTDGRVLRITQGQMEVDTEVTR